MQNPIDTNALAEAMEQWSRDHWQPMARRLQEAAVALGEALEPDWEHWRVRSLMPNLTMRDVLVHRYVPPQGGVMWPSPDDYARGGVIRPRDHGDSIPVMLSPGMPAEEVVEYYGEDLGLRINGRGRS